MEHLSLQLSYDTRCGVFEVYNEVMDNDNDKKYLVSFTNTNGQRSSGSIVNCYTDGAGLLHSDTPGDFEVRGGCSANHPSLLDLAPGSTFYVESLRTRNVDYIVNIEESAGIGEKVDATITYLHKLGSDLAALQLKQSAQDEAIRDLMKLAAAIESRLPKHEVERRAGNFVKKLGEISLSYAINQLPNLQAISEEVERVVEQL